MPKRISIAPHLNEEELYQRYRAASKPVERTHYQIIWLLTIMKADRGSSSPNGLQPQLDL